MRLIKAKVSGYKRLADNCQLNLDANPVCIVGPNAAGKSSFLDALVHLNHDEPFEDTEKTRVPGGNAMEPEIEARFLLDEHEIARMKEIPEAVDVRQFLVVKKAGWDSRQYSAYPYPNRNLTDRANVLSLLQRLRETGWIERAQGIEEALDTPPDPLIGALFETAVERASSSDQWLEGLAGDFDALGERIGPILAQIVDRDAADDETPYEGPDWPGLPDEEGLLELAPARLAELARFEREEHPLRKVIRALQARVPEFLKFDEDARALESEYDLNDEKPEPDLGIHNFLALAGTSWDEAVQVMQRNDAGWTKIYIDERDEQLKKEAALQWGQSEIEVKLSLNSNVLSILLSMQARDLIGFDEHSDGLKAFMALRAFVAQNLGQTDIKPIVLIDEADLHLHYDAQADLIGVFEEQDEAAQIVYTTHSAGCLPRDLAGVRAIVPETEEVDGKTKQKDHSEAINRYWTMGKGFSPLLLAMGAGAFAFSSTQYALITEGMSDALLLPTLIREATDEDRIQYQPVPSFADATPDEIERFDLIAGRIAFLADGDEGGRNHVKKLTANGIDEAQVVYVGDDEDSGFSVEDLLVKSIYLKAVNDELIAWHGVEFPASELPEKGRSKAVEDWCAQQTGRDGEPIKLSKVDVAQRVLDQRSPETKLLAKASTVKKINENVLAVFEGAPERMRRLREAAAELAAQTASNGKDI